LTENLKIEIEKRETEFTFSFFHPEVLADPVFFSIA